MPAEPDAIRVNHCQIAATHEAARAQCAKAFACKVARANAALDLREPAEQDRDRAAIGRAVVAGRPSAGRGVGQCMRCCRTMSTGAALVRNGTVLKNDIRP
ncbi:hypothetical protein [Burkholderia territorii]|uniref:hypothetical protein n=1 Tax=Burkholderia territorii TaxID=1503055 RepID=UPI0018C8CEBF|nr:hypothetical protein [Burkholderia territorii]